MKRRLVPTLLVTVLTQVSAGAPLPPPTLRPITLPGYPFAFACIGPTDPVLLDNFTGWLFEELKPNARATLAYDVAAGPWGWNANGSADAYIKYNTPALFYQKMDGPIPEDAIAVLRRLDAAGVYHSFQIGEWGNAFHCLTTAHDPTADHGCGKWVHGTSGDCGVSAYWNDSTSSIALGRNPANRSEARAYMREAYLRRLRMVQYSGADRGDATSGAPTGLLGGLHSTPGFSYYSHEPARWGAKLVGFEVGENIENAQTHVAVARGSSRQWGVPWHMQLSPWHGNSETTVCAGGEAVCVLPVSKQCVGRDAGHSLSFLRRMFVYHWLAGAAVSTAECCSCYGFDDGTGARAGGGPGSIGGKPWNQTRAKAEGWGPATMPHFAAPNGEVLVRGLFRDLYRAHDRGTPFTPLAVVLDEDAGFGGSVCSPAARQDWGVFAQSPNGQAAYDLLHGQLLSCAPDCQWPHIDANLSRGETMQLRATPHGEAHDVLLTDARPGVLALYEAVLLVGDVDFDRPGPGADGGDGGSGGAAAGAAEAIPTGRPAGLQSALLARIAAAASLPGSRLSRVLMLHDHADAIGAAGVGAFRAALNSSGSGSGSNATLEVLPRWTNPALGRPGAISDARLAALVESVSLVRVDAAPFEVQWLTNVVDADGDTDANANANESAGAGASEAGAPVPTPAASAAAASAAAGAGIGGVLVYVANNKGVAKPACEAQVLDPGRATVATVVPNAARFPFPPGGWKVEEWLGGVSIKVAGGGTSVTVSLGPGDAAILYFTRA